MGKIYAQNTLVRLVSVVKLLARCATSGSGLKDDYNSISLYHPIYGLRRVPLSVYRGCYPTIVPTLYRRSVYER